MASTLVIGVLDWPTAGLLLPLCASAAPAVVIEVVKGQSAPGQRV